MVPGVVVHLLHQIVHPDLTYLVHMIKQMVVVHQSNGLMLKGLLNIPYIHFEMWLALIFIFSLYHIYRKYSFSAYSLYLYDEANFILF